MYLSLLRRFSRTLSGLSYARCWYSSNVIARHHSGIANAVREMPKKTSHGTDYDNSNRSFGLVPRSLIP